MDAYRYVYLCFVSIEAYILNSCAHSKGLDAQQTAFAIKKYSSHRRIGLPSDIIASMAA
jgi:hypothetical protein